MPRTPLKNRLLSSCLTALLATALVACSKNPEASPEASGEAKSDASNPETPIAKTETKDVPDLAIIGKIYTGAENSTISQVIIDDGFIVDISPSAPQASVEAKNIIELGDAIAYPGFVDAHAHLGAIGFRELQLNLEGVDSIAALKTRLAKEVATRKPDDVLYGRGWIETGWPENRFPSSADLDEVSTEHTIILERADGHAIVANSKALKKAGITDETVDPSGGRIERDTNGKATGMLIDNAGSLVMALLKAPSDAQRLEALQTGAEVYAAYGWTGTHSMSVDPKNAELLISLEEQRKLPIRVYNALVPEALDDLVETGLWDVNDGKVTTRSVKFYIDGALGSRGAALKAPYSDEADNKGLLLISEDAAKAAYRKALENDIQVTTHAIGDRGNTLVLDWYTDVLKDTDKDHRWRIEHAQIVSPLDYPRFKELGVIASMQPSHAIGDLHFAPDRLGKERLNGAYAWRSLTDAGAIIAGGSDAPVERGDPMIEFYATVARKDMTGFSNEDWHAEEALTRAEALSIFTKNAAYASFQEENLGTIEIGKKADITILSADIMTIPEADILKTKAIITIVDGTIVYDAR